jgi:hypothetical protein
MLGMLNLDFTLIGMGVILILVMGGGVYAIIYGEKKGRAEAELESTNEALDDVSKANAIIDAWNHDAELRKRVREKYTRK